MRWSGLWLGALSVACVAAPTVRPGVHVISVDRGPAMTEADLIASWHDRAAELCGGARQYDVVSTLVDHRSGTYREGGRFDEDGARMRVPAIRIDHWHAEGIVRCFAPDRSEPVVADRMSADACKAGDAAACMRAANGRRAAGDEPGAHALLVRACRAGEAAACLEVGSTLAEAGAVEPAADYFKRGCKLGDDACCEAFATARITLAARSSAVRGE